ncbi:MAG: hypothetical protein ACOYZ7_04005 [Chloroflexota bacterium]
MRSSGASTSRWSSAAAGCWPGCTTERTHGGRVRRITLPQLLFAARWRVVAGGARRARRCYARYSEAHVGMVCNVVTYRARSALRDVARALAFPPDVIDRATKALDTHSAAVACTGKGSLCPGHGAQERVVVDQRRHAAVKGGQV